MVIYRELASAKLTAGQAELAVLNRKCNDARRRMMYHLDAAMTRQLLLEIQKQYRPYLEHNAFTSKCKTGIR